MAEEPPDSGDNGTGGDEPPETLYYDEIIWLSTLKAAARMGITTRTLYRFIDRGDLPAYRFGRVIRLRLSDVDTFIEQSRVEPGSLEHLYPEARMAEPDEDGEDDDESGSADDD